MLSALISSCITSLNSLTTLHTTYNTVALYWTHFYATNTQNPYGGNGSFNPPAHWGAESGPPMGWRLRFPNLEGKKVFLGWRTNSSWGENYGTPERGHNPCGKVPVPIPWGKIPPNPGKFSPQTVSG